jgi:hypothetical protein
LVLYDGGCNCSHWNFGSGGVSFGNTYYIPQLNFLNSTANVFNIFAAANAAASTPGTTLAINGGNTTGTGGPSVGGNIVLTPGTSANSTAGNIQLVGLTTGTNADFLCLSSGNVVLVQTSACTISSMRFKEHIAPLRDDALATIAMLRPVAFNMKQGDYPNADPNFAKRQIGLLAENVAAVDPRLAIFENDGVTPKSYRQESIIALTVKAIQQLKADNDNLKAEVEILKRVNGR